MSLRTAANAVIVHDERPSSIDLSLELERQLEIGAPSPSPDITRPTSLDPHVLASIVTQLRQSLFDISRERDDLSRRLHEAQAQESQLRTAMQQLESECTRTQDHLAAARRKMAEDESAIAMLRTKVEESRRGVMRLQTENRRVSQASLGVDMSRALPIIGGQSSSKRASFTPLTGSGASIPTGHRRMSSLSDSGLGFDQASKEGVYSLALPDHASRRHSVLPRISPFNLEIPPETEVEALRLELRSAKEELEVARRELFDAKESREASDTCVKALREFIQENNIGAVSNSSSAKPPPFTTGEDLDAKKNGIGWAFKLWNTEQHAKSASSPNISHSSPIRSATVSSAAPLSKRFGELFGSRTTMAPNSSVSSVSTGKESFMGSDGSSIGDSVPEPISPPPPGLVVLTSPERYHIGRKHDPAVEEIDLS